MNENDRCLCGHIRDDHDEQCRCDVCGHRGCPGFILDVEPV